MTDDVKLLKRSWAAWARDPRNAAAAANAREDACQRVAADLGISGSQLHERIISMLRDSWGTDHHHVAMSSDEAIDRVLADLT